MKRQVTCDCGAVYERTEEKLRFRDGDSVDLRRKTAAGIAEKFLPLCVLFFQPLYPARRDVATICALASAEGTANTSG
jgi:hypothetical protein